MTKAWSVNEEVKKLLAAGSIMEVMKEQGLCLAFIMRVRLSRTKNLPYHIGNPFQTCSRREAVHLHGGPIKRWPLRAARHISNSCYGAWLSWKAMICMLIRQMSDRYASVLSCSVYVYSVQRIVSSVTSASLRLRFRFDGLGIRNPKKKTRNQSSSERKKVQCGVTKTKYNVQE